MSDTGRTRIDPAWKQAVLDFIDLDPKPGTSIDDAWLREHFDLQWPEHAGAVEWKKHQLKMLEYTDKFKSMLAEQFNLILSDRSEGQMRVLAPAEVADYTEAQARRDLRAALRRQSYRLKHTNVLDMTQEQRQRHIETQARVQLKARNIREAEKMELPAPTEKPSLPKLFFPGQAEDPGKEVA